MSIKRTVLSFILLAAAVAWTAPIQDTPQGQAPPILDQKERAALFNRWLAVRFEKILPTLMRRENIDMWVVICREHNEDPVYWSLVPSPSMFAWRTTMFVYYLGPAGLECLSINRYGGGDLHKEFAAIYKPAWEPENIDPWERLALVIRARDPRKIAINESREFPFSDGLSAENKTRLVQALGPDLSRRLVSSERLAVGWLETRTAEELDFYPRIVALNHRIVREAFSSKVITPGLTTIDDLEWWVRERLDDLHLTTWFPPMFYILRPGPVDAAKSRIILPGDLLRCDVGVVYMGLCSDIQEIAYVPRPGETEAPKGLTEAMALGNRLQDILAGEFRAGRTGNEVQAAALSKARAAGLVPRIYSHPLGYNGHGAGPRIGLPDMQDGVSGLGDYPLHPDTVYAIELSVQARIPEWNGLTITMALEEDASFTTRGLNFLDGRQTKIIMVK